MAKLFTAAELEEMRRADEEIDREFRWTKEELKESRERERDIVLSHRSNAERKIAAKQKAYYEANREEIAAKKKAYYEANREEIAAYQKAYREANREEIAAKRRDRRECAKNIGLSAGAR